MLAVESPRRLRAENQMGNPGSMARIVAALFIVVVSGCASVHSPSNQSAQRKGNPTMRLGNFCICLAVKDLAASRAFYEGLGFKQTGHGGENWLVLQNDTTKIGLFQGMFDKNVLTFNPGWDSNGSPLAEFDDVRDLQKWAKANGLTPETVADDASSGPASFTLTDPDGNPVWIDQHVPRPQK